MEQFVRSFLARQVPCICDHLVTTALQRKLFSAKQMTKIKVVRYSVQAVSAKQIAPLIIAKPTTALADETVQIHIENLQSNQPITLHSALKTEQNDIWESYSHYISSSDGIVQVDKDKSHGGSYTGCEPMGFVWSLKPSPGSPEHSRLRKHDVTVPFVVQVSVLDGHISEWSSDQTALAVINLDLWYMAPGVRRINIRHNGIVGTLFLPAGHGPFPGIVDLWGGVPGLIEFRASLLASHGFATLALAYIGHPDLPYPKGYLGVTSEYFEEAYNFLKNQPQVVKDRIGIIGYCSGVFISLRMATEMLSIKPRCVVGVSGAHFWVMSTRTGHLYAFLTENILPEIVSEMVTLALSKPSGIRGTGLFSLLPGFELWQRTHLQFLLTRLSYLGRPDDTPVLVELNQVLALLTQLNNSIMNSNRSNGSRLQEYLATSSKRKTRNGTTW
ncbi:bile acid-CoA:amino acid N-acyltransferase-like [Protopterus annectens]|uniref:bile acid-CoA:amino acid N-acyltransferase-like n=1 Tax=Protopterus annectens TaxID=7888 RepID=UPI001CF989BC|nr:bile acid-CoA:amino acid N-acyltransferase-like [Protopterus annectens]